MLLFHTTVRPNMCTLLFWSWLARLLPRQQKSTPFKWPKRLNIVGFLLVSRSSTFDRYTCTYTHRPFAVALRSAVWRDGGEGENKSDEAYSLKKKAKLRCFLNGKVENMALSSFFFLVHVQTISNSSYSNNTPGKLSIVKPEIIHTHAKVGRLEEEVYSRQRDKLRI